MNFDSIRLFDIASKRMNWLAERQQVVSENIANADTPDFRAKDLAPFERTLDVPVYQIGLQTTQATHRSGSNGNNNTADIVEDNAAWSTGLSGNTVVLEQQAIKATEIEDGYQLAAELYRKAHQLLTLATAGRR